MVLHSLACIDQLSFLTNNAFVHLIMDNRGQAKGITATRGHNPKCAATSRHTFCANINDYPYKLVLNGIRKSNIDIRRLLVHESRNEEPDLNFVNSARDYRQLQAQRLLHSNNTSKILFPTNCRITRCQP
uniref:Uncharacterized protein n=1 Tax=Dendroctonus ponderosae TaxID=77166 RepID=A0AAR5PTA5_DENPD